MTPALEIRGVTVRYGGLVALRDVSMAVGVGEIVGLIGPNGAGKTTLLDAISGVAPYEGSICLSGDSLDALRSHQRAARGLGRTFQALELFDDLTVREHACLRPGASAATVDATLSLMGLEHVAGELPAAVATGTRRFVALARAVADGPRLLLLDEVAAGLDSHERSLLVAILRRVVGSGQMSVLLVDHDLGLVSELSHRVVVLHAGQVIAAGPASEVRRDERVLAAYLGRGQ